MSLIPTLTTDRLILRGPAAQDAEAFVEFFGSDRAIYVGGPKPPRQSWLLFAAEIGHWAIRGYGMWTVTTKDDDRALGLVGMYNPKDWPEQELGWILFPEAEGKGIAYEAALAARRYAYQTMGWQTAVSYIDEPNTRSRTLAEKLGCKRDEQAEPPQPQIPSERDDIRCLVYRHPSPAELGL